MQAVLVSVLLAASATAVDAGDVYQTLVSDLEATSWHDSESSTQVVVGDKESFQFLATGDPACMDVLGWYQERLQVYEVSEVAVSCRNFKASVCGSDVTLYWSELADCG